MPAQAAPVPVKERIVTLDAIRGFALLGIFIMNMPYFGMSFGAVAGAIFGYHAATVTDLLTATVLGMIARVAYVVCRVANTFGGC